MLAHPLRMHKYLRLFVLRMLFWIENIYSPLREKSETIIL